MNTPTILLVNDDGINSPGLAAAAKALLPLGRLVVAAPETQQTSMGRAYTGNADARFRKVAFPLEGVEAYALDASPAAVVRHALFALHLKPTLVVSGINYGENVGINVTGSGTVGATFEAFERGLPGLAVSLETDVTSHHNYTEQNWDACIHFTRLFAGTILARGMTPGADVLKVEVPAGATENTPWKARRISTLPYYKLHLPDANPNSRLGDCGACGKFPGAGEPNDTDAYAIRTEKVVAVTPMTMDMTAYAAMKSLESWAEKA